MAHSYHNILGIDVGEVRVGLATAHSLAKLPSPHSVLKNDQEIYQNISDIIKKENIQAIVVGLPRNMKGEETAQSNFSRQFAAELAKYTSIRIDFADESLSSVRASGKDDIAACYILEEYLSHK